MIRAYLVVTQKVTLLVAIEKINQLKNIHFSSITELKHSLHHQINDVLWTTPHCNIIESGGLAKTHHLKSS